MVVIPEGSRSQVVLNDPEEMRCGEMNTAVGTVLIAGCEFVCSVIRSGCNNNES